MREIRKSLKLWILVAVFSGLTLMSAWAAAKQPSPSAQGGAVVHEAKNLIWEKTAEGWKCVYNRNGKQKQKVSEWMLVQEEGVKQRDWYYFDANGIMQTGWLDYEGKRYYLQPDGKLISGDGVHEIEGEKYLFSLHGTIYKSKTQTLDGVQYTTDENGKIISSGEDKNKQNEFALSNMDQIDYLNVYRKEKGISLLQHDTDFDAVAKKAFDYAMANGENISLSTVYSIAVNAGHNVDHIGFIFAAASGKSGVYLNSGAEELLQNLWYTRVGYYRSGGDIMIIVASYPGEEATQISLDQVQGIWVSSGSNWKYKKADETYAVSCWVQTPKDSKWYHFDANGIMQTGWFQDLDGKWYYLDPFTGAMAADTVIDGYYVGSDGAWVQ